MNFDLYHPDALIGRQIAGYEITGFIDSGSAGLVFRGKRVADAPAPGDEIGTPPYPAVVAIKLLAPSVGASAESLADFQRRFEREADVLKRLTHPHILSVIDSGEDADTGYFYMALPYMAGGSLASALVTRGPLPLPEVASILERIADALDFAHAHGVIHRDVKPGNILLDDEGEPYLGDFGIVRLLSDNVNVTQRTTIGRVMGSPAYMAPEQFSDTSKVGPLSDLYSLGMVVYQMVTGRLAFETTNWPSLIYRQLSETPTSPRAARSDLPEPAAAAILHALEKEPARRFPTATAFAQTFALGLHGLWAEELTEYMAAATMPATPITEPIPVAPALAPALAAHSATQTWPAWPMMAERQGSRITRRLTGRLGRARGATAAAAILLLVSCLAGILYIGANGSAQAPLSQSAAGAGSNTATARPLPTATSTPRQPSPTATKSHGGDDGAGAPAPSATSTPTASPSPTVAPSPTTSPSPTASPSPSPTETPTPLPSPTATDTPTPVPPPAPTDTPAVDASISIGWSQAYSSWIWMTLRQFSPGAYTFTCNYGSGRERSYAIVVSADPQTWDNGSTCFDKHDGDTVWVTIDSVMSNVIVVPET